jgi:phosphoglycerate dehydrogenase-like enzyme
MLMLCAVKGFTKSQRDLEVGVFGRSFGGELDGRTLGLIGLGSSGRALALLSRADVVSIHVPLTPDTGHMIGSAEFREMKNPARS